MSDETEVKRKKPTYFSGKAPNGVIENRGAKSHATDEEVEESQRE